MEENLYKGKCELVFCCILHVVASCKRSYYEVKDVLFLYFLEFSLTVRKGGMRKLYPILFLRGMCELFRSFSCRTEATNTLKYLKIYGGVRKKIQKSSHPPVPIGYGRLLKKTHCLKKRRDILLM